MPQNKKHHYVPKFYLKRFTSNGRSINLYNLKTEKTILAASLKGQCYRNHFYGDDQSIEKALMEMEGSASHLLRLIDKFARPPPPRSPEHYLMMVYLLTQHGRTAAASDTFNEWYDKFTKVAWSDFFTREKGIDLSKFEISIDNAVVFALGQSLRLYPLLFDMDYKLLVNKTEVEFVTSDHPVVLYNQLLNFRDVGGNCGLACKGLQVFFPVDPKKMILMYDGDVYRVGGKTWTVEVDQPQDVYELNTLQMCSATSNVYFRDPRFDVLALHRKARPFLRTARTVVRKALLSETPKRSEHLIGMSSRDIRTNLQVSAITLLGSAKDWRAKFKRQRFQPVGVVRNPKLLDYFDEFESACENNKYDPGDFPGFLADKLRPRA